MIDTVVFDMDGVICNTNPFHVKAFDAFFEKRDMPIPSEESYLKHMYGKSNRYIFSHYLGYKVSDDELEKYEFEKEGLFREIYRSEVKPIDGYLEFLSQLVEANIKLGVATSAPRANMDVILDALEIRKYFGSTLGSEDVTNHKPDPQVYLKSARNLVSDQTTCVVFEDSHAGATAGLRAGMKVVGVLSSHTPEELPECNYFIDIYKDGLLEKVLSL